MTKPETQLTLQDELKTVGSKNGTGDLTYGQQQAVLALFTQALTSLRDEMEKKKQDWDMSMDLTGPEVDQFNEAISECQRLIDGVMK